MKRRDFLNTSLAAGTGMILFPGCAAGSRGKAPAFLQDHEDTWMENPRKANLEWFKNARYGLFMHYGLYSLLGRHEWVQLREKIPVQEYARLTEQFTASEFDADFITDMALEAEMKYINITTKHHDSFCLWDTKYSDFKSTNTPAKRDLLAELSEQCNKKGLGLFFYYSHGRDWKHPHAPNNDKWKRGRPDYDPPDPSYKYGEEHDLEIYIEFVSNQVRELLEMFSPLAGIWLDGISTPKSGDFSLFRCQELYDMIHEQQSQVLVSYKQGLIGTEDFNAPERHYKGAVDKPLELCNTMQPKGWGYMKADDGRHRSKEDVLEMLRNARELPANVLLNTGPLPSGKIHPHDVKVFKEVGEEIRTRGWEDITGP